MSREPAIKRIEDATLFYDPLSFTSFDHPYETYAQLRKDRPVYFNERRKLWVISRYEDVRECLYNHAQLVNKFGNDIDGTHDAYGVGMLVCQDPPHHTVLREAIRPSFSAQAILAMENNIREHSKQLIGDFHARGSIEFTNDIALPLVFSVALNLVGVPPEDAPHYISHLKRGMERTVGKLGVSEDAANANSETEERLALVVEKRREELAHGGDRNSADAITQILNAVAAGKVDDVETVGLSHLVLSAATDAPAALLSNCVALLDRFPALQSHLAEHPEKIENFVEEVLRFEGPAQNLARQSVEDIEIAGTIIPANSRVLLLLSSANRDEQAFEEANSFNVDRDFSTGPKILSFGEGIHSCMGAPLARLTTKVFLEELLNGTEIRIEGTPVRWIKQMVRGYSHLPLTLVTEPDEHLTGAIAHHDNKIAVTGHRHLQETSATLTSKAMKSETVAELVFSAVDGSALPEWQPGAHIDLMIPGAPTRQYSLCGDPSDLSSYRLGVLREEESRGGSRYIHDSLEPGDTVTLRGPRNNFALKESTRYIFIAGGIGITPLLPMISAAELQGSDWELHYVGRSEATMAFTNELAAYGEKVRLWPKNRTGRLDLNNLLSKLQADTLIYCCGPESLLDGVEEAASHWPAGAVQLERFSPKPMGDPVRNAAFVVELARSERSIEVVPGVSILDALQREGVDVVSSCGEGTCGTCETAVIEGEPDHRDSILDKNARERCDRMMICVSRACGELLILDL